MFPIEDKELQPLAKMQQSLQQEAKTTKEATNTPSYTDKWQNIANPVSGTQFKTETVKPSFENKISASEGYDLVGGEYLSKFPTFKQGRDNSEFAAQNQGALEQSFNGLTKAGNNLLTTVVGNTGGFVYGIANGVKEGNLNAVFDNSFSKTLDDWNTKLNYQLPNYYTEDDKKENFFGSMVGSSAANFWFNDVAQGLSFTLGTLASEAIWAYATGGTSLAVRGAALGAKIGKVGRWGKLALGAEEVASGVSKYKSFVNEAIVNGYKTGKLSKDTAIALGKAGDVLTTARFIATTSGNEAGIEAFHFKKEARENFDANFERQNGRVATTEERAKFEEELADAANGVFATNMAILGVSNMAMFGGMFNIKTPFKSLEKQMNKSLFGVGTREVSEGVFKGIEATKGQKIFTGAYHFLKPSFTEGVFEEGLQGVTTKTANKWVESTYNPKYHDQTLSIANAAYESMAEQYGSKEGLKEVGIGGLIGLFGVRGAIRSTSEARKYQEDYVAKGLNVYGEKSLFAQDAFVEKILTDAKIQGSVQRESDAIKRGDAVGAHLAQNEKIIAELQFREHMGDNMDDLSPRAEIAMNSVTEEMWNNAGIQEQDREAHIQATLEGYKQTVNSYKEASNFANALVGNGAIRGTTYQTQVIKDALTHAIVSGETSHVAMNESLQDIKKYVGEENAKVIEITDGLNQLSREKQNQVSFLTREHADIVEKEAEVEKKLAELQAKPKSPTEGDRTTGTQLQKLAALRVTLQERRVEIEQEQEVIASEISQLSNRQAIAGETSDTNLNVSTISGQDLRDIDKKMANIDSIIEGYSGTNKIDHNNLMTAMKQYKSARDSFYTYQGTVDAITNGKFKIKDKSGFLFKLFDPNYKMDDFTTEFLADIVGRHIEGYMDLGANQELTDAKAKLAELEAVTDKTEEQEKEIVVLKDRIAQLEKQPTLEERKAILEKELETIQDDNDPRIAEIDAELNQIEKELTVDDTPNLIPKDTTAEKIAILEEERKIALEEVEKYPTEISIEDKKANIEEKINSLPDNLLFVTHITSDSNALSIFNDNLLMPAGVSPTTGIIGKVTLKQILFDLIDGKSPHRGYFDMFIGAIDKNTLEANNGKTLQDKLENYLDDNFIDGVAKTQLPNSLNFGYFTNGVLTTKLDKEATLQKTDNSAEKEKINKEYDQKIAKLKERQGKPKTDLEILKERIAEVVKNLRTGYISKDIDEMVKNRPDQKDMDRYEELIRSVPIKTYFQVQRLGTNNAKEDFYNKNKEVIDEYEALYNKLSNWRIYDSLVYGQDSIVDLLDYIQQMEEEVQEKETFEVGQEAFSFLGEEAVGDNFMADLGNNTNFTPTAKLVNKDIRLTHIKASTIISRFENPEVTVKQSGKKKLENPSKEVLDNLEEAEIIIKEGANEYRLKLTKDGRLYMDASVFKSLSQLLNMYTSVEVTKKYVNWSYHPIMEIRDGEFVPMQSDFKDKELSGDTFELEEGDSVELFVDVNDPYNQKILKEKNLDRLISQVRIYIRKNGKNFNILKALNTNDVDPSFLELREKAAQAMLAGKSVVIGTTKITYVPLGLPIMTLGSDNTIQPIEITQDGLREVVTTGYILNGELVLANKGLTDKVRKSFVAKLSKNNADKKVPIIVFRRGKHLIAFPITMNKTSNSKKDEFTAIVEGDGTDAQKIKSINNLLLENGLMPSTYGLISWDEEKLKTIETALDNLEDSVPAEALADTKYDKNGLITDAKIALDLEDLMQVMPSQKLNYDLKDIDYTTKKAKPKAKVTVYDVEAEEQEEDEEDTFVSDAEIKDLVETGEVAPETITNVAKKVSKKKPLSENEEVVAEVKKEAVAKKVSVKKPVEKFTPSEHTTKKFEGVRYFYANDVWNTKQDGILTPVSPALNKKLTKNSAEKKVKPTVEIEEEETALPNYQEVTVVATNTKAQEAEYTKTTTAIEALAIKLNKLNFNVDKDDLGMLLEDEQILLIDNLGEVEKARYDLKPKVVTAPKVVSAPKFVKTTADPTESIAIYENFFKTFSKKAVRNVIEKVRRIVKDGQSEMINEPIVNPTQEDINNHIPPVGAIYYEVYKSTAGTEEIAINRFNGKDWLEFNYNYIGKVMSREQNDMTNKYFAQIEINRTEKPLNCE